MPTTHRLSLFFFLQPQKRAAGDVSTQNTSPAASPIQPKEKNKNVSIHS